MSTRSAMFKATGYAAGAAMAASLGVMLVAMWVFGFRLADWAEWQGGIAGIAGTIAGIVGAVIGLKIALRTEARTTE